MARVLLKRLSPFAFPGGNPGFDPTHLAVKGATVRLSAIASGGAFTNLLTGKAGAKAGTPTSLIDSQLGPACKFSSSTDAWTFSGNPTTNDQTITLACIAKFTSISTNQALLGTSTTDAGAFLGCGTGPLFVRCASTNTTIPWQNFAFTNTPGIPFFLAVSINGTKANAVVVNLSNGNFNTATAFTISAPTAPNGTYEVGNIIPFGLPTLGDMSAVMFSTAFLSVPELFRWGMDPWSFWYPHTFDLSFLSSPITDILYPQIML
jgi:hypothetical protein